MTGKTNRNHPLVMAAEHGDHSLLNAQMAIMTEAFATAFIMAAKEDDEGMLRTMAESIIKVTPNLRAKAAAASAGAGAMKALEYLMFLGGIDVDAALTLALENRERTAVARVLKATDPRRITGNMLAIVADDESLDFLFQLLNHGAYADDGRSLRTAVQRHAAKAARMLLAHGAKTRPDYEPWMLKWVADIQAIRAAEARKLLADLNPPEAEQA